MLNWPFPSTLKSLRGFLGLTGYYRKFIKGYSSIAAPLTSLLRKNSFEWTPTAKEAFTALKNAVTNPPVLILPDFTKPFIIQCDASGCGVGAVLMQQERPIAFMSQVIHRKALHLSTYEKELMALVLVVKKWCSYVLGQTFRVQTDHQSLKYLLEQKVGTPMQQKWLTKLLGFDFLVGYKKGKENLVADALSRKFENAPAMLTALTFPADNWISTLRDSYSEDPKLQKLISGFAGHKLDETKYDMKDGLLFYKGRLYISDSSVLKNQFLHLSHGSPQAGHSGFHKTLSRAKANFYWMGMKADIKNFIKECDIYQRNKNETIHPAGLLQPLPIPTKV